MPRPTEEKWYEIAAGFQKQAQFPHCIGAIDGKHVRVLKLTVDPCTTIIRITFLLFFWL
jgi:hypothetical protein